MAQDRKLKNLFKQFKKANTRLEEALKKEAAPDIKRDAVIKRFEFTYELLWKTFKELARAEKMECYSPKSCFKVAFKLGLIEDEELFLEIIDARNKTTHVYSEKEAKEIYNFVKKKVVKAFEKAEKSINEKL